MRNGPALQVHSRAGRSADRGGPYHLQAHKKTLEQGGRAHLGRREERGSVQRPLGQPPRAQGARSQGGRLDAGGGRALAGGDGGAGRPQELEGHHRALPRPRPIGRQVSLLQQRLRLPPSVGRLKPTADARNVVGPTWVR
eukprot:scaffold48598_cov65-Phaeocystis_antarctica.AAC.2